MDLLNHFRQQISFLTSKQKLILAVSGGVDSVVLCELSKQAGLDFVIAHCNFGLRGEESDRDEAFVKDLGEKYGVDVIVKRFETSAYAEQKKLSIQEAARELRYEWFASLNSERVPGFTFLAHHANDNIETLLMNFFRGTGLNGMTGMNDLTPLGNCARPMMSFTREEIEQFAKENNLQWIEDSSNQSSKYTRNFFRNELIPSIKKVYPKVEQNLLDNINRFKKITGLYDTLVKELKEKLCLHRNGEMRIPVKELMKWSNTSLIYEIIKEYGFGEKQVDEVVKLANADSGKFIRNDAYRIIRHRHWFLIVPTFVPTDTVIIDKNDLLVRTTYGSFKTSLVHREKFKLSKSSEVAQLDASLVEFPLLFRKWKQGDYFYPLGMRKKKKIARFLIDLKIPKNQKDNTWVVESGKKIIWVVSHRIDDRFKITDKTQEVLLITNENKIVG